MSAFDSRPAVSATVSAGAPEGRDTSAVGSVVQGTAEREALARVLDPHLDAPGMADWERQDRWRTALYKAGLVLAGGYRRVVEDEDTVERAMWACAAVDDYLPGELSDAGIVYYTALARAALQALRDGSGQ